MIYTVNDSNLTIGEVKLICEANAPFKSGELINAIRYSEDETKISAIYDTNAAPHIIYQEYGFIHWLSGKFVDVNQWFIRNKTVGALENVINSGSDKQTIMATSEQTMQSRQSQMSQSILTTYKGNENRSGRGVLVGQ